MRFKPTPHGSQGKNENKKKTTQKIFEGEATCILTTEESNTNFTDSERDLSISPNTTSDVSIIEVEYTG